MRTNKSINRRGPVRNRRNKAGETLAETLVAMLIIGLSSVLFLTTVLASTRIFQMARDGYRESYELISSAEKMGTALSGNDLGEITVTGMGSTGVTVDVNWYGSDGDDGDENYVLSYKVSEE